MALVRWNPWTTMPTLQDRINRVFDDMFPEAGGEVGFFDWRPMVDTYEKDDAIVVKAELPGIKKEDISIDVNNNVLTIKGERKHDDEVKEESYHRRERFYGHFQRAFTLPDNVDAEKIEAKYNDGVLEVTVPKTEETRAKKIPVH